MDTELSNRLRKIETRLRFIEARHEYLRDRVARLNSSVFTQDDLDDPVPDVYVETEETECSVCHRPMTRVRPGKVQCDFCEALEAKLKPWREWRQRVRKVWENADWKKGDALEDAIYSDPEATP